MRQFGWICGAEKERSGEISGYLLALWAYKGTLWEYLVCKWQNSFRNIPCETYNKNSHKTAQ